MCVSKAQAGHLEVWNQVNSCAAFPEQSAVGEFLSLGGVCGEKRNACAFEEMLFGGFSGPIFAQEWEGCLSKPEVPLAWWLEEGASKHFLQCWYLPEACVSKA